MTKIAIQPNASGTGTFTIAAPNSNVDRTFSLPDATGEVLTSAGGAITGNVSVGTIRIESGSPPTLPVESAFIISDGQTSTRQLIIGRTNDGVESATMRFFDSNNNSAAYIAATVNNAERFKIDSAGFVTMPNQPIISGQIGTAMTSPVGPVLLNFNVFWVSRGITYNSGTRRFTVPVAGIYRITMNPFKISTASFYRVVVGVNTDSPTQATHFGHSYASGSTFETGCIDSVVSLAANDYIVFRLVEGGLYNTSTDLFNQFTIAKIA